MKLLFLILAVLATPTLAASPADPGALSPAALKACPTIPASFARNGKILKLLRAVRGPDGQSKIEPVDIAGSSGVYYGGKVSLTQFPLGDPSNVVVVYGHPNMAIPPHPSPYREMFLILSGSSTIVLADGSRHELTPGMALLSEDQDTPGRGGSAGPCGYVAIDLQYKTPAK